MFRQARRISFVVAWEIAIAILAMMYATAGKDLIAFADNHQGEFSNVINQLDLMVPLVIAILALAPMIWLIVAPVQEERARRIVR